MPFDVLGLDLSSAAKMLLHINGLHAWAPQD
jgi:hypothetical protein